MTNGDRLLQLGIAILGGVLAGLVGLWLFVEQPTDFVDLVGILLALVLIGAGLQSGRSIGASVFPAYNVAEVGVDGPIMRNKGGSPLPSSPMGPGADAIVEQIERADADGSVDALLLRLNTPGGEIVPSDDIRQAAADFDGPTIAYTTDLCASGGYWIAAGCDELWARELSIVGSIGVRGSRINLSDLADRLGISYERFVAGEYKDAGNALREIEPDEREYLQDRIDGFYDQFVEQVADGRELDESMVRDTEARVYLGEEAHEMGLVDELGTADDVKDKLADDLGVEDVIVEEFSPQRGVVTRIRSGTAQIAYAFGAGIASVITDEDGFRFR